MPLFKIVILPKKLQEMMKDAAKTAYPTEACGILLGHIDNEKAIVKEVVETENSSDTPTVRFYIDPKVLYKILMDSEARDLEFLGIFHSHPAKPRPSPWDLNYMKLHQNVWIIIQSQSAETAVHVKAYQWFEDKLLTLQMKIV